MRTDPNLTQPRIPLTSEQVGELLAIYNPDHRYVEEAVLQGPELRCLVKQVDYPFTVDAHFFPYITAPTAALLVAQLSYVLIGGMALTSSFRIPLSWTGFIQCRDLARLRFVRVGVRYRREVQGGPQHAVARLVEYRDAPRGFFSWMTFRIGDGIVADAVGQLQR